MFLLESVNAELGVTGEFVGLGVTEFGFSDGIISVVELLADSICRKLNYFSAEKMKQLFFLLLTTTFCLTNSSILFTVSVLLTLETSVLEMFYE